METLSAPIKNRVSERASKKDLRRILLIDHEAGSALSSALAAESCHVVHCDRVQKAWNFVYPRRPDLIIFSIRNSDQTALSDLHECRALAGNTPILVATSVHLNQAFLKILPKGRTSVVTQCAAAKTATKMLRDMNLRPREH